VSESEVFDYTWESQMLFLHFLVVATALFGLSCADESLHNFENFVHSAHLAVYIVLIMCLQKPVVLQIFLKLPVASIDIRLNQLIG